MDAPASEEAASVPALSTGLQAAAAGTSSALAEACASGSGQPALEAETEQPLDEHQAAAARGADELADALGGQSEQPGAAQAALHPGQRQAAGAMLVGGGEEEDWMAQAAPAPAPARRLKRLRRPSAPSVALTDQPPALTDRAEQQRALTSRSQSASPLASAPGSAAAGAAAAPAHLPARCGAVPAPSADSGSGAGSAGGDGALPADYWDEEDELEELVLKRKARAGSGSGSGSPDAARARASPSGSHSGESGGSDAGARPPGRHSSVFCAPRPPALPHWCMGVELMQAAARVAACLVMHRPPGVHFHDLLRTCGCPDPKTHASEHWRMSTTGSRPTQRGDACRGTQQPRQHLVSLPCHDPLTHCSSGTLGKSVEARLMLEVVQLVL